MRLLSFDTSTPDIFLALSEDGKVAYEKIIGTEPGSAAFQAASTGPPNRQQAVSMLIPSIEAALTDLDWPRSSLDCVVVGVGPGGFTGIRVAVVTARTLAQALRLPLIGLSSLDCLAYEATRPTAVVVSAHAKHYYVAGYRAETLTPVVGPHYATEGDLPALIKDFDRIVADEPTRLIFDSMEMLPTLKNIAVTQLQIAFDRLSLTMSSGKVDRKDLAEAFPYSKVEPLYLRGASITVKKGNV